MIHKLVIKLYVSISTHPIYIFNALTKPKIISWDVVSNISSIIPNITLSLDSLHIVLICEYIHCFILPPAESYEL